MKFGPTSANSLPARIIWCVSDEAKAKLAALAIPGNEEKIRAAPVTAIIAMDTEFYEHLPEFFPHTDARRWFAGNATLAETTAFSNSRLQEIGRAACRESVGHYVYMSVTADF